MNNYFEQLLINKAKSNGFEFEDGFKIFNAFPDDKDGLKVKNAMASLGTLAVSVNKSKSDSDMKDLKDLTLVNKSVANCRLAMQIDPTTFASVMSLVMVASRKSEITADKDVDQEHLKYIKQKWKDWKGEQIIFEMLLKGCVDGESFIEKVFDNENPEDRTSIMQLAFLPYQEENYDFMEIKGSDGVLKGYMQKAEVLPIPDDWRDQKFDDLKNLKGEVKSIPFGPDEVINPKFLENDNRAESLVMKVLDYVYIKKSMENEMPSAVKRSQTTLGIEVGNAEVKYKFGTDIDSPAVRQSLMQTRMNSIASNFSNRESKEAVAYPYGVKPEPIGSPQLPPIQEFLGYVKQEIRQALFTPDSRFESATGSRFTAGEQLSGSMGQVTVVEFMHLFAKWYIEKEAFDHELQLQDFTDSVGGIHLTFPELDTTSEELLSKVADVVDKITGGKVPRSIMIQTFFKRLDAELRNQGINIDEYFKENEDDDNKDPGQTTLTSNENPIPEINVDTTPEEKVLVNAFKKVMNAKGWIN